jgi:hypothetical protein
MLSMSMQAGISPVPCNQTASFFRWGDSAIPEYVSNHNIGSITQVEGRHAHICVRNESLLHCGGKGALLLQ